MPNWCNTAYAIEGDAKEVKSLYETMKELQERKEPSVENGFGTTWLGCLVDALGGDWNEVWCRGDWGDLHFDGKVLKFNTITAWAPCIATFDFVSKKFPTLRYYYQAEEPGMAEYWTNDREGKYFPDKYIVHLYMPNRKWFNEHFTNQTELLKWFEEIAGQSIKSQQEIYAVVEEWQHENNDAFCNIYEYEIDD